MIHMESILKRCAKISTFTVAGPLQQPHRHLASANANSVIPVQNASPQLHTASYTTNSKFCYFLSAIRSERPFSSMPPRKRATKAISDEFINDDEDDVPQSKRTKTKASEATINTQQQTDDDGNVFWEIGGRLRRVAVSKFRGSVYVNIREHYEKDGKILPGKKGIMLSIEQFNAMMSILPQLQAQLSKESGSTVAIPDFGTGSGSRNKPMKVEELDGDEDEAGLGAQTKPRQEKKKKKSKIVGSDEEEEDD